MKNEIKQHLLNKIIPFWDSLADYENGGFRGYVGFDLNVDKDYFKGAILHSRILWFYSNCYLVLKGEKHLQMAKHCYDFMVKHFHDCEHGGIYWSVTAKGEPHDTMKHGYCNAFFIYALASYYDASKDSDALDAAMEMFNTVETKMIDDIAYRESCDREWNLCDNDELSENGIQAVKTMNTVLHLIEAYTELYRVCGNSDVLNRLEYLYELAYDKLYDKENRRLSPFFDKDMKVMGDIQSYGHDIEAAWLFGRGIDIAGDALPDDLCKRIREMNRTLVEHLDEIAFDESGAMFYESQDGIVNKQRSWWTQTEAFVGFLEAYRLYGEQRFLERAAKIWEHIKEHFIDKREGGEWFNELYPNDVPVEMPIVDEWKCPYHNGRMCLMAISKLI